jgi:endonuclease III
VCEKLEAEYGRPRHGNPKDPLEDLVYVLLSNRTPPKRARRVYEAFRERFPTWEDVLVADSEDVVDVLRPAGFANRRARQVRSLLEQLRADFGSVEAPELWKKADEELLVYLTSLRGVSDKVARCVMMYALDRNVLPVDVHVHRVASRLGWTDQSRPESSHTELEALLPKHRYYAFHVTCIAHGRARCTASNPGCEGCPIRRYCAYYGGDVAP